DLADGETRVVSFTYKATDSHGADSDVKTVTITLTGQNDAPVAVDIAVNAQEDGTVITQAFAGSDVDSDDDQASLTYAIVDDLNAGEGSVINNTDGTFTYDPGSDFQDLAD